MHTTNSDGELAPRALARHYGRAGYDVVALTDHWHRSEAPSSPELVVLPGVELNCLLPEDRDGHVLGIGIERDPAELAGERRDLAATGDWIVDAGGVAYLAHPYWTGARAGRHRASAVRDGHRGVQRRLRARGRPRALVGALGRAPPGRPHLPGARHRRQPPPGVRLGSRLDVDPCRARPREHPRRPAHRPLLREHRTAAPRRRDDRRGRRRPVHAGPVGHAADGEDERCRGERGPAGLPVRRGRSSRSRHDGWILAARLDLPETAPFARLEVVDPAGRRAWTNPLWPR